MRLVPVLAVVAVSAALAASASGGAEPASPLLGVRALGAANAVVQRFDPTTLRPLGPGRRLGMSGWLWSWSPDRSRIAFAGDRPRHGFSLVVLDTRTLGVVGSRTGRLELKAAVGGVQALVWLPGDRLLLVSWDESGMSVAHLVDAVTLSVIAQVDLGAPLLAGSATSRSFVGLLGPRKGIGRARVVSVDRELHVADVKLDRIHAGWETSEGADGTPEPATRIPALAVDPAGRHAVVVGYREPVADVDLATGVVRYHAVPVRTPSRTTKVINGPMLRGFWLGENRVAVTGTVYQGLNADHELRQTPVGLQILDLRTWTTRMTDAGVGWLSSTGPYLVRIRADRGLDWYSRTGRRLGTLFGRQQITELAAARTRALVLLTGESSIALVDFHTGKVVERRTLRGPDPVLPVFLVPGSAPAFG